MSNTYQIYLISDSTGETLDRIFTAIKAQFKNIDYKVHTFSFTRTENQILKILSDAERNNNSIILYSVVDNSLAKCLAKNSDVKGIPCFGVLGDLILSFSKLLNQKASHQPSGQYTLNEDYYKRIEAIQFTMNHDDGNLIKDIKKSDIILLGVSRTSKTPTAIYLANKGFKTSNIPLVNHNSIPKTLKDNPKLTCVVGLNTEPERLVDLRKNRMNSLKETENKSYTDLEKIKSLDPAFLEKGTITAATSSPVSIGAAAVLLTSRDFAEKNGLKIRANIKGRSVAGVDWRRMGMGPLPATQKILSKTGLSMDEIDVIELNEAFAAQSLYVIQKGNWDISKVNHNGGAIALGHPLGCSGARIITTLVNVLEQQDAKRGLATMCIGTGQGIATILERD